MNTNNNVLVFQILIWTVTKIHGPEPTFPEKSASKSTELAEIKPQNAAEY